MRHQDGFNGLLLYSSVVSFPSDLPKFNVMTIDKALGGGNG
jgi:hypothetical protein